MVAIRPRLHDQAGRFETSARGTSVGNRRKFRKERKLLHSRRSYRIAGGLRTHTT
jgi:hypothetical protein